MDRLTNSGTKEAKPDVTIRDILDKLARYEDLEEQGKLFMPPCAVSDTVYMLSRVGIVPLEVYEICIFCLYGDKTSVQIKCVDRDFYGSFSYSVSDIGKRIFLTREDAAKELAKKGAGNELISKQKVLDILKPRLKSAVYDSGSRGTLETQRFYSAIESVKTLPVLNMEESAAYICDNLCRHSHNNDLTQEELDEICNKCKVTEVE